MLNIYKSCLQYLKFDIKVEIKFFCYSEISSDDKRGCNTFLLISWRLFLSETLTWWKISKTNSGYIRLKFL